MNNSIVKLEDFELDEISGGFNKTKAKQVAKKAGSYAIKGTISAVLGFGGMFLTLFVDDRLRYVIYEDTRTPLQRLSYSLPGNDKIAYLAIISIPEALSFVAGWKIGGFICKKFNLED